MTLNINNTAIDWGTFLLSLSEEAGKDAASTDAQFALHGVLRDLSLVSKAYAARLGVTERAATEVKQLADAPADPALVTPAPAEPTPVVAGPSSPADQTPGWLLDTLASQYKQIEELRARVDELERNQQKTTVSVAPLMFDPDEPILPRDAWNSVDQARTALRLMVDRELKTLTKMRQTVLKRVTSLAMGPRDALIDAELRQHQDRARELESLDLCAAQTLDRIAGIDDLETLRAFKVTEGWPQ